MPAVRGLTLTIATLALFACSAPSDDGCPGAHCQLADGSVSNGADAASPPSAITHVELAVPNRIDTGDCGGLVGQTDRSYSRYWQDDFTRSTGLPDAYFAVATEPFRINDEQQLYGESGVRVDEEGLHLMARRVEPITASDGQTYSYTSGEVYTSNRENADGQAFGAYGRWEVCARLPTAQGSWPAIWLLANEPGSAPGNAPWPPEIDIMEHVGDLDEIQTNVFWGTSDAVQSAEANHLGVPAGGVEQLHLYAVEYDASHIDFYVDGVRIRSFDDAGNIPAQDMYLVLNLAVGGVLPSYRPPCDQPVPGVNMNCADGVAAYDDGIEMLVRYVRRYE